MLHAEHEDGSATNGKGARACDGHTLSPSSPKSSAIANMAPRHAPSSSDLPLARPTGAVGKDTAAGSPNTASMELASPNRGGPLKTVKHADPTAELSPSHMPSSFIPGVVAIPMPLERNEPPPATDGTPTRSSSRPSMDRPLVALTLHCSQLYHDIDKSHCERQRKIIGAKNHNDGFDEEDGHYAVICRERIIDRFLVLDTLGKGSFGTVVKCYDEKRKEIVALKISRCGAKFREQAKSEMDILTQINRKKTCEKFVVKFLKAFDWKKHLILVFPRLSHNLYQVLAFTQFQGCTLDLVRKIAFQLIHALQCLESHQPCPIIHCDLKPENIMLVNRQRSGIRLIDFGSACYHDRRSHRYIQSRFYRSPEVILGLPYTTAIDRWSLGCVLVELYRGTPLFEGRSEEEQLSLFEYLLGPVPNEMVESSPKKDKFFFTLGGAKLSYRLKRSLGEGGTLSSWLRDHHKPKEDREQKDHFITFIEQILRYEPEQRLSCKAALEHPFITEIFRSLKLPQPTEETK